MSTDASTYSLGGATVSFYTLYSLSGAALDRECARALMLACGRSFPIANVSERHGRMRVPFTLDVKCQLQSVSPQ